MPRVRKTELLNLLRWDAGSWQFWSREGAICQPCEWPDRYDLGEFRRHFREATGHDIERYVGAVEWPEDAKPRRTDPRVAQLEQAREKLATLKEQARKNPGNVNQVAQWANLRREVQRLEKELAANA